MDQPAAMIARRLADNAEAVCRHYLSQGRREGRYWLVGNIDNEPGRSLYVRLASSGEGTGRIGKWTDAQSGEHGDLLDIVARRGGNLQLRDALAEARRFLGMPEAIPAFRSPAPIRSKASPATGMAARRLWLASGPIDGTTVASYLAARGVAGCATSGALRHHPRCHYRRSASDPPETPGQWPAMIAAVTDLAGAVTGVHRTWLDPRTTGKAAVASPRRAMGALAGNGVRFGPAGRVVAVGEGLETVLSLRLVMPAMPMIAALSAVHLGALALPEGLSRLYVACDADEAGHRALARLSARALPEGITVIPLVPRSEDFNADLVERGRATLAGNLAGQLDHEDLHLLPDP